MSKGNITQKVINAKEDKIKEIQIEETLKLRIADTLKETTRMAGEFRVNAETLPIDDKLKSILTKGREYFAEINKELSAYLSTL